MKGLGAGGSGLGTGGSGLRADHAQAENGRDFVAARRLEADGDRLLALQEIRRQRVFVIDEARDAALRDRLLREARAVEEDIERPQTAVVAAYNSDKRERSRRIDRHVVREPLG